MKEDLRGQWPVQSPQLALADLCGMTFESLHGPGTAGDLGAGKVGDCHWLRQGPILPSLSSSQPDRPCEFCRDFT